MTRSNNRRTVETMLKRGFQFNTKEKRMVVPMAFLTQDHTISQIMLSCAKMLGFSVVCYQDAKLNCSIKNGYDDFFLGLLYSMGSPRNTKLSHSKVGRDLSYAIGMSLRLKGYVQRFNVEAALRPNNFFFANNNDEFILVQKRKVNISYGVKNAFLNPFESAAAGSIFYKVVSSTLMHIGLADLDQQSQDLFVTTNLLTFDDFVKKNWVEVWSEQRGSKTPTLVQVRKATFPSRNAMLLNEELDAIKLWTKPFFSSVEDLRNDFYGLLFLHGYTEFSKLLSKRYSVRHVILQNLASVTTKRLQAMRRSLNVTDLKKKSVTREKLVTFLSGIQSPIESFRGELNKILSNEQSLIAKGCLGAEIGIDGGQVIEFLLNKVAVAYVSHKVYDDKEKLSALKFTINEKKIALYEKCYKKQISCKRICDLVMHYMNQIVNAQTPDFRGLLYRKVLTLCDPYLLKWKEVREAMSNGYDELIKELSTTAKYFDALIQTDSELCHSISIFLADFAKRYNETAKVNTLPKSQDDSMAAFVKKSWEAISAAPLLKK